MNSIEVTVVKRKQRQIEDSIVDVPSLFECPVCLDYAFSHIFQCPEGHIVCCNCKPKLTTCPTCRTPLGNIRNLAMEKIANAVFFPCKHSYNGCTAFMLHNHIKEHENKCEFKPYNCPFPGSICKWEGNVEYVLQHLAKHHGPMSVLEGESIVFMATDIYTEGAVIWAMVQSCYGQKFLLLLERPDQKENNKFFSAVRLIGPPKEAEKFSYRLDLKSQRRRFTWEATPKSIHEESSSARVSRDAFDFDASVAKMFESHGSLKIIVTIMGSTKVSFCNRFLKTDDFPDWQRVNTMAGNPFG